MGELAYRTKKEKPTLSNRGAELASRAEFIDVFKKILEDPYDPDTNPDGFVNLGTSENYLMLEENAEFASRHISFEAHDFSYGTGPWGTVRLRKAMAKHINRHFHPHQTLEADDFLIANGVTSLCEMLGFVIGDAGDAVLLSRPCYQAFPVDFGTKAKVRCEYVSFGDLDQFDVEAVGRYKEALKRDQQDNNKIKALILCHPHNPLGRCYTREALIEYMQLCDKYKIHLVVDEIYALSVYDIPDPKAVKFESVLSLDTEQYISPQYLHFLYGMSKDSAAGGIRIGCFHTRNEQVMRAMKSVTQFHWSGVANEKIASAMLEDEKWMDDFLQKSRDRLGFRNVKVRKMLDDHKIKYYLGCNAGFFLWIDLRPFLPTSDDLWAAETKLSKLLFEQQVYLTDGKSMNAEEPGWFRLIFSQEERVIEEGFRRILKVIGTPDR